VAGCKTPKRVFGKKGYVPAGMSPRILAVAMCLHAHPPRLIPATTMLVQNLASNITSERLIDDNSKVYNSRTAEAHGLSRAVAVTC